MQNVTDNSLHEHTELHPNFIDLCTVYKIIKKLTAVSDTGIFSLLRWNHIKTSNTQKRSWNLQTILFMQSHYKHLEPPSHSSPNIYIFEKRLLVLSNKIILPSPSINQFAVSTHRFLSSHVMFLLHFNHVFHYHFSSTLVFYGICMYTELLANRPPKNAYFFLKKQRQGNKKRGAQSDNYLKFMIQAEICRVKHWSSKTNPALYNGKLCPLANHTFCSFTIWHPNCCVFSCRLLATLNSSRYEQSSTLLPLELRSSAYTISG